MNRRNADALAAALAATGLAPMHDSLLASMAKQLSKFGVLVPSVLTDDEVADVCSGPDRSMLYAERGEQVRADLARIAKGEEIPA